MNYTTVNTLSEFSFIAGTIYVLEFSVVDDGGSPVDLGAATCSWNMAYFSNPTEQVLSKDGVIFGDNNESFRITLDTEDTQDLYGKFVHQPVIVDFDGKEYRLEQGILTILPRV